MRSIISLRLLRTLKKLYFNIAREQPGVTWVKTELLGNVSTLHQQINLLDYVLILDISSFYYDITYLKQYVYNL